MADFCEIKEEKPKFFNKAISFIAYSAASDGAGGTVNTPSVFLETMADIIEARAKESLESSKIRHAVEYHIYIGNRSGIVPEMQILYGTKYLEILAITEKGVRLQYLYIVATDAEVTGTPAPLPALSITDGSVPFWATASSQFTTGTINWEEALLALSGLAYLNFSTTTGPTGYGIRDNSGTMEWKNSGGAWAVFGSGGGVPGGSDTQIQFNDGGVFGGDASFVWDKVGKTLTLSHTPGSVYCDLQINATGNFSITPSGGNVGIYADIATDQYLNSDTNTFLGINAGSVSLEHTAGNEGWYNIGIGFEALGNVTKSSYNIAIGIYSLHDTTEGADNIGIGAYTLQHNTTGNNNIGIGRSSLIDNIIGNNNVAVGYFSLEENTSNNNVAVGYAALRKNTTGYNNVAVGISSLSSNLVGYSNVAVGPYSLSKNEDGAINIGMGLGSLFYNVSGNYNIAIGHSSLYNTTDDFNIAIGHNSLRYVTSGSKNMGIGYSSGNGITTGINNICIGYDIQVAAPTGSDQLNIGDLIYGDMSGKTANINGSMFIGDATSIPAKRLEVADSSGIQVRLSHTPGSVYGDMGVDAAGDINFTDQDIVKIHQSTDNHGLNIYGNVDPTYFLWNYMNTGHVARWGTNGAGLVVEATSGSQNFRAGTFIYLSGPTHVFRNLTGSVEYARILSSGKFGINTSSPAQRHEVADSSGIQQRLSHTPSSIYCDIGTDASGNLIVTPTGDNVAIAGVLYEYGTFAEIYVHDNSTAQSIPTGATYTLLTAWASNGESNNATPDATNDKITITKTGRYSVSCSISGYSGTANVTFLASVFLGGVEQDRIHWKRKFSTANDIGSMSMTGIIDATSTGDVDVRARHDNGGSIDLTVAYGNFKIEYLGET